MPHSWKRIVSYTIGLCSILVSKLSNPIFWGLRRFMGIDLTCDTFTQTRNEQHQTKQWSMKRSGCYGIYPSYVWSTGLLRSAYLNIFCFESSTLWEDVQNAQAYFWGTFSVYVFGRYLHWLTRPCWPKSERLFDISSCTGARSCTPSVTTNCFLWRWKEGINKQRITVQVVVEQTHSFIFYVPTWGTIFLILMSWAFFVA